MSNKQPKALRLADELENYGEFQSYFDEIASELRLLYTSNEQLAEQLNEAAKEIQRLQAVNELLSKRCQQAYNIGVQSGREDCEVLLRQAQDRLDTARYNEADPVMRDHYSKTITAIEKHLK